MTCEMCQKEIEKSEEVLNHHICPECFEEHGKMLDLQDLKGIIERQGKEWVIEQCK